jgi:hypothetical protein
MKLEKGRYYFLRLKVSGRELEYKGEIVFLDSREFVFNKIEIPLFQ